MSSPAVTLLPGDCLTLLRTLPAQSVDLVLADLPYGTTSCHWDSVIPLDKLWAEYRRVLKPRGAVVLTASQPFTTALISSNLEWFKYTLVWEKNRLTNFYNVKFQPGKAHEDIVVFAPGAASYSPKGNMTYNPQMSAGEAWTKRDVSSGRHTYHVAKKPRLRVSDGQRYPQSVLRFDCEFTDHPTQKPVALFAYLIRTYSNPGDLVLDNCAGSGTCGVAAIETGRRAILMERDPAYCAIIERRIAAAQPALLQEAS